MKLFSNSPNDNFSERLRFWRISQDFTQAEAAKMLDIDRSYYSQCIAHPFPPAGENLGHQTER
jgi:predicted XRE-type DNA-binding protein